MTGAKKIGEASPAEDARRRIRMTVEGRLRSSAGCASHRLLQPVNGVGARLERLHHAVHRLGKHHLDQFADDRILKFKIDHEINHAASVRLRQENPMIDQMPEWAFGMRHIDFQRRAVQNNTAGISSPERLIANDQIGQEQLAPIHLRLPAGYARAAAPGQKFRIAGNIRYQIEYLRRRKRHRMPLFVTRHR